MPPIVVKQPIGFTADERPTMEATAGPDGKPAVTIAEFFRAVNAMVTERDGEWCGIPVPLKGAGLVLEDRHPGAATVAELQRIVDEDGEAAPAAHACSDDDLGWQAVNSWRTRRYRGDIEGEVVVLRHEDGRVQHGFSPSAPRRNGMLFGPFEAFEAWTVETELAALARLGTLLTKRMFACYFLTGAFLETSKRSGLTYMFRRLRPTIAMTPNGDAMRAFRPAADPDDGQMRVLACLCLHPLGYYARTFCGAMCPTDDVIAHLLLMRGDEHLFWKRANQHQAGAPESGL